MGYNNNKNSNNNNEEKTFKKSGFEVKMMNNDNLGQVPICSGWKKTRKQGMVKVYARPYAKSKVTKSETGKLWINLFVTLTSETGVEKMSGMFDMNAKKLYIKELNLIGTTKGGGMTRGGRLSKGYFGKHIS